MPSVRLTERRFLAHVLKPGDRTLFGTVRSVMKLNPYDVFPGSVQVTFTNGAAWNLAWMDEVPEVEAWNLAWMDEVPEVEA